MKLQVQYATPILTFPRIRICKHDLGKFQVSYVHLPPPLFQFFFFLTPYIKKRCYVAVSCNSRSRHCSWNLTPYEHSSSCWVTTESDNNISLLSFSVAVYWSRYDRLLVTGSILVAISVLDSGEVLNYVSYCKF